MRLILKEVTSDNFQSICNLTTNTTGIINDDDPFIDSNQTVLQRLSDTGDWKVRAINVDDIDVGLAIYGYNRLANRHELLHFMIDYRYQHRGYGKLALDAVLGDIALTSGIDNVYLIVHRDNVAAHAMYEHHGFIDTFQFINHEEYLMVKSQQRYIPHLNHSNLGTYKRPR